jgi:hypothetical protein
MEIRRSLTGNSPTKSAETGGELDTDGVGLGVGPGGTSVDER